MDFDTTIYLEYSRSQDAATIEQFRQRQQMQTFTFSNNMNTDVRFDHMGVYVEGTISEVRDERA